MIMKLKLSHVYLILGLSLVGMLTALTVGVMAQSEQDVPSEFPEPDPGNLRAFVELVRSDIRTQKTYILAQNMELTNDEAVEFWPLQREYNLELNRLYDRRFALIRKFLSTYDSITDDQACQLADEALSLEESRTRLKRKYFTEFSKVITPRKAVRFFQIENQINAAIDLRIAAALPLIK
jgi:hypothetical protein